jgi:hypothetical protein
MFFVTPELMWAGERQKDALRQQLTMRRTLMASNTTGLSIRRAPWQRLAFSLGKLLVRLGQWLQALAPGEIEAIHSFVR